MSDTKISALTARTTLAGTDEFPNLAGGANYRSPVSAIATYMATATLPAGTLTASAPKVHSATLNNAAVDFVLKSNEYVNTASGAATILEWWTVGGADQYAFMRDPELGLRITSGSGNWTYYRHDGFKLYTGFVNSILVDVSAARRLGLGDDMIIGWGSDQDLAAGGVTYDTRLKRIAASVLGLLNASTGGSGLQFAEMTAPTAPAANNFIIFAEDNGSGKTRAVLRFPTGTDVVLGTEA